MFKRAFRLFTTLCIFALSASCAAGTNTPAHETTAGDQNGPGTAQARDTAGGAAITAGTSAEGRIVNVEIPAPSLANNKIEEPLTRNIIVYLPESYDKSGVRYPTVYYLGGWSEQCEKYGAEILADMKELVEKGKAKDMIVVVVDGRNRLYGSFYTNSPVTGNWEDYIVNDVRGYIDSNYRTIDDAASRGISGLSMGGFGSLSIAMHHPDVFSCVYSMSPGIYGEERVGVDFGVPLALKEEYKNMSAEEAHKAYMQKIASADRGTLNTLGYISAFAPDSDGKAPYIRTISGAAAEDKEISDLIYNGSGGWAEKVAEYGDNLKKLKAIHIEYGKYDEYAFIPVGCEYLSELLKKEGIDHSLAFFVGAHANKASLRIKDLMLPFFSERLTFE